MCLRRTALAALMVALPLASQTGPPASRPGPAAQPRAYDPAREATLHGRIREVVTVPGGRAAGIHLRVVADGRDWEVHLAPAWFLERRKWTFSKDEEVIVTGARAGSGEGEYLIAREVKRGGEVMVLRDATGLPQWRRGGPGPR